MDAPLEQNVCGQSVLYRKRSAIAISKPEYGCGIYFTLLGWGPSCLSSLQCAGSPNPKCADCTLLEMRHTRGLLRAVIHADRRWIRDRGRGAGDGWGKGTSDMRAPTHIESITAALSRNGSAPGSAGTRGTTRVLGRYRESPFVSGSLSGVRPSIVELFVGSRVERSVLSTAMLAMGGPSVGVCARATSPSPSSPHTPARR
ncbi:uncharacterized protein EI97DRAFT_197212 [Westerdykella ornata]|uniref:Uncharacterized protein n=1 Tax=Westerdykella ornata TaxID=318751 RepID=A0A6A6JCA9_WESOR|nr:uncharacterized protein EI97DRAFT_197212 [Westerdykella ornata]KAF2272829.1 hypothetical protein EI97DRAFT_197212 [Westerdykella ornata]